MADLARAFVSFFAIIDPIGNVIVFHLYTQGFTAGGRLLTAFVAVGTAFVMLLIFSIGGTQVLDFLDISADSFKVAAGLLLLLPAFRLIMEGEPVPADRRENLLPVDLALVPLATPLLAGPGALAASISFSKSIGAGVTIGAFSLVLAISVVAFIAADWLFVKIGPALLRLLSRIVGIILFAIAVNLILSGVKDFANR